MQCGKDSQEGYKMEDIREEMNIVFIPSSDKRMLVLSMLVMYYDTGQMNEIALLLIFGRMDFYFENLILAQFMAGNHGINKSVVD